MAESTVALAGRERQRTGTGFRSGWKVDKKEQPTHHLSAEKQGTPGSVALALALLPPLPLGVKNWTGPR